MEAAAAKAVRVARSSLAAAAPCPAANGGVLVFFAALVAGALVTAFWMSASARIQVIPITPVGTPTLAHDATTGPEPAPAPPRFTDAGTKSTNQTPSAIAPANFAPPPRPRELPPAPSPAAGAAAPALRECPAYFRWIHEDLRPWRATGVTLDAVEGARRYAPKFRVTVVAGRLYVARYGRCFQTRDVFTQWGMLQLLRRYPGRVPDLDLMFDCDDLPVVDAADRRHHPQQPPPLFRYCGSEATLDIAFPDWSFWGRSST